MSGVGAEKLNAAEELNATAPGEEVMEDESQRGTFDPLAAEQLIDMLINAPLPTPSTHKVMEATLKQGTDRHIKCMLSRRLAVYARCLIATRRPTMSRFP